ncbi:hypothetical protein AAII07_54315 [Microvirga sp. 0TCS3.31]
MVEIIYDVFPEGKMPNITREHADITSTAARWHMLTKAINTDLEKLIGREADELAVQILDRERDETLKALVELPVTYRRDAAAVVEVVAHILRYDQSDDDLEARLLSKVVDYLEDTEKADFAYLRQS